MATLLQTLVGAAGGCLVTALAGVVATHLEKLWLEQKVAHPQCRTHSTRCCTP